MFYFVPSWYSQKGSWSVHTPYWYRIFETMNFDDTIHQFKIFEAAGEEATLLLLSYQPQLRYFLHKQGMSAGHYWSFFDHIQNIHRKETKPVHFRDLNWPQGTQFIYTPFSIYVKQGEQKLADIHFAENGNLLQIHYYEDAAMKWDYQFDDRGFVSSILYYENGRAHYRDYLNESGVWQVREYLEETEAPIEINPIADQVFQQAFYHSWEELILEQLESLTTYLVRADDQFVIAANSQHNSLLIEAFPQQKKIFSLFEDRFELTEKQGLKEMVAGANLLVTANKPLEKQLHKELILQLLPNRAVTYLPIFDTRLRLGKSQTMKELIIYWLIDGLSPKDYQEILGYLLKLMIGNSLIRLQIVTYNKERSLKELEDQLIQELKQQGLMEPFMEVVNLQSENQLDEDCEWTLKTIQFQAFTNENQIIEALDKTRLVLDLSGQPDIYTQIASLSAGIPQIHLVESDYVVDGENGRVLSSIDQLPVAIAYYFDGLSNWNKALVHAVKKMGDYTSEAIIAEWKKLLKE